MFLQAPLGTLKQQLSDKVTACTRVRDALCAGGHNFRALQNRTRFLWALALRAVLCRQHAAVWCGDHAVVRGSCIHLSQTRCRPLQEATALKDKQGHIEETLRKLQDDFQECAFAHIHEAPSLAPAPHTARSARLLSIRLIAACHLLAQRSPIHAPFTLSLSPCRIAVIKAHLVSTPAAGAPAEAS